MSMFKKEFGEGVLNRTAKCFLLGFVVIATMQHYLSTVTPFTTFQGLILLSLHLTQSERMHFTSEPSFV